MTTTIRHAQKPTWQEFRGRIIDTLWNLDRDRFVYVNRDTVIGVCPACKGALPNYVAITFHGEAPRADIYCSLGCDELAIADAIGALAR
jgi:hypothetical protein